MRTYYNALGITSRLAVIAAFALAASCCSATVGAGAYKGADPIGGGSGYTRCVDSTKAAFTARNLDQLKAALAAAKAGDVVYVADGAEIDATGEKDIVIPGGVTLAGDRGSGGSSGPVIKASELNVKPSPEEAKALEGQRSSYRWFLFIAGGPGVRVTGLRILGPDTTVGTTAYAAPNCDGIETKFPGLEVDNCEMSGWSHAAVFLNNCGQGARIHHNYIHNCRRNGLGYGVCLAASKAFIEANRFVDNRHDIAGTGRPGTAYTARYNISDTTEPTTNHAFDMHGNHESRKPGEVVPHIAGDYVIIYNNTFRSAEPRVYIRIRGEPTQSLVIHDNLYENPHIGASFASPCADAVIYRDLFKRKPRQARYRFESAGNLLDGKRMPKGDIE